MAPSQAAKAGTYAAAFDAATALHKAGNIAEAAARYEQLCKLSSEDPQLLYLLGGAYVQLGRARDAIAPIERSLTLRPGHAPALDLLGSAWVAANEPARALPYFRESAAKAAAPLSTVDRLAATLLRCNLHDEALAQYTRCLAIDPANATARIGAATALVSLGRLHEAEDTLRVCLNVEPTHVKARMTLGTIFGQQERFADAEQQFRAAVDLAPNNAEAHYWLGASLQKQSRPQEATDAYAKARALSPSDETIAIAMAEALIDAHRLDEARVILDGFATMTSDVLTALGRIEERRGNLAGAIAHLDRAVTANPQNEAAYINRGNARRFAGDYEGALSDYDAAIAIKPSAAAAVANRGLALLTLGRLSEAWPLYRSRIRAHGVTDLTAGKPWDGGSLGGKRVLVWMEYGLGDEILFANMMPDVLDEAAHCTLMCAPRLMTLFQRSFPRAAVAALGSPIPTGHDVHVALTDLAQRFRPSVNTFPRHNGYLKADERKVAAARARYPANKKVVGISWRSVSPTTGAFKSAPLEAWQDILSTPDLAFVSLQYGNMSADLGGLRAKTGLDVLVDTNIDSGGNLDEFAAQVAAMDLVISISNTTVHVAGALGKPTWILVPEGPGAHWYWFRDRPGSPFYPSARLFRQKHARDWQEPLQAAATALREWAQS